MVVPFWIAYYLGIPYVEHGRKITGLDRYGLYRLVLSEQLGIALPSFIHEKSATDSPEYLIRNLRLYTVDHRDLCPGDIMFDMNDNLYLYINEYFALSTEAGSSSCLYIINDITDFDVYRYVPRYG